MAYLWQRKVWQWSSVVTIITIHVYITVRDHRVRHGVDLILHVAGSGVAIVVAGDPWAMSRASRTVLALQQVVDQKVVTVRFFLLLSGGPSGRQSMVTDTPLSDILSLIIVACNGE